MQTSAEVVLKSHSLCSIIILNTWHTIVKFKRFNCNACTKPQEGRNAPLRVYNMHLNVTLNNITTSRALMLLADIQPKNYAEYAGSIFSISIHPDVKYRKLRLFVSLP